MKVNNRTFKEVQQQIDLWLVKNSIQEILDGMPITLTDDEGNTLYETKYNTNLGNYSLKNFLSIELKYKARTEKPFWLLPELWNKLDKKIDDRLVEIYRALDSAE